MHYDRLVEHYITKAALTYGRRPDDQSLIESPLHSSCVACATCWASGSSQVPTRWPNTLHLPFVGGNYATTRLIIVGQNFNGYGGLMSKIGLCIRAQSLLHRGYRRLRFENPYTAYRGTDLYHRASVYAAVILRDNWSLAGDEVMLDSTPLDRSGRALAAVFDDVAMLNAIKCSPDDGARSAPLPPMYQTCPEHYLRAELEILEPRILLLLGLWMPRDLAWLGAREIDRERNVALYDTGIGSRAICVPHPASVRPSGMDRLNIRDLATLLRRQGHKPFSAPLP